VPLYGPVRKFVGYIVDTRTLEVQLLPRKRAKIIDLLRDWTTRKTFLLLEAAQLLGLLEDAARYNKWGRAWFFLLHNALRDALQKRAYFVARQFNRAGRKAHLQALLPGKLKNRVLSLVSLAHAKLLWGSTTHTAITSTVQGCIADLLHSFSNFSWCAKIPFIIRRDPNVSTTGDASELGGGGFSTAMRFWFEVGWSDEVKYRVALPSTDPGYVQINCLEFLVVILQLAATIVLFQTPRDQLALLFPDGIPVFPVLLAWTDSTASKAWANKVSTGSIRGQYLLTIYAELLRLYDVGVNCDHLAGELNILADFISRPTHFHLSPADRAEQIFRQFNFMRTWRFFQPSHAFLQLLRSHLLAKSWPGRPSLPPTLGRFVPAGSTTSSSVTI
jgi:hypothetical protein